MYLNARRWFRLCYYFHHYLYAEDDLFKSYETLANEKIRTYVRVRPRNIFEHLTQYVSNSKVSKSTG